MAIFCGACGRARDLPVGAIRTSLEPCQFCHGFESQESRRRVGRNKERVLVTTIKLHNFDYPDKLINSMPGSYEAQAHKEYEGMGL